MKFFIALIVSVVLLSSCPSKQVNILDNVYLGMTIDEYQKAFNNTYILKSTASKLMCSVKPVFTTKHLSSLSLSVDDIADYDTAYNVFELGNDFIAKYGNPLESREIVWAGGSSKYFTWKKGMLDISYHYRYNQIPGTSGLPYTGEATLSYKLANGHY